LVAGHRRLIIGLSIVGLVLVGVAIVILATRRPPGPFRFFSSDSVWNRALPADAQLDPGSAALVSHLVGIVNQEQTAGNGPNINTNAFSVPIYTVGSDQGTVRVSLRIHNAQLAAAFGAVPLPNDARPATGSDGLLVVWQPSADKLWEFWQLHRVAGSWHASWGGAMRHVQQSDGIFSANSWPGSAYYWGASATSLPEVGGLMRVDELRRGQIDHALALAIPDSRAHVWSWPAQRTDGTTTDPDALPEGARLRLDPSLDLKALHLPPVTLAMARAAQRYGVIVRDTSPVITFYAQDTTPTGTQPYYGRDALFSGLNPRQLLASFPWSHLQVLKLDLHGA
jgi:hypothetical protein